MSNTPLEMPCAPIATYIARAVWKAGQVRLLHSPFVPSLPP